MTALALDGTSPLDLGAVTEVFGIDRGLAPQWYDFSVCGQQRGRLDTRGGLRLTVDRGLDELAAADTIIVLPVARFIRERPADAVLAALAAASARGSRLVSLCLGAFVLAAAGLLDGRRPPRTGRTAAPLARLTRRSRWSPTCSTSTKATS